MGTDTRLQVKRGQTSNPDAALAVREFHDQVQQPGAAVVVFFCSPQYDLAVMGRELQAAFDCPVVGCTTAGEISSEGYTSRSLVGASLKSDELHAHPQLIPSLQEQDSQQILDIANTVRKDLKLSPDFDSEKMFSLLLVDGMSMREESLTAHVYYAFGEVPLLGGSAGDELSFKETYVYWDGEFRSQVAVVTLVETTLPFTVVKSQHFEPTNQRLVITGSDPQLRVVKEINGIPAAEEYARLVDMDVAELNPSVFSVYPLMLKIGGQFFIRSIQKVNPDKSLSFYCAIEDGLVLRIGRSKDLVCELDTELKQIIQSQPETKLIIACDCILRRLEIQNKGIEDDVAQVLKDYEFIGFSTYGEQFNAVHVNQTLTAVAIGG